MNKELQVGEGVKSFCSNSFMLFDKIANILRHFGTKIFRLTIHNSRLTELVAFTLAETLIVMGVIGVVAALTLPNLNSSTGDKERVAKVKKIYQNLQDAFGRAEAVYGPYSDWFVADGNNATKRAKRVGERMTEFMKISKDCKQVANAGCFTSGKMKGLHGDVIDRELDAGTQYYRIITADGMSIAFVRNGYYNDNNYIDIYVDIDGPSKGGYIAGKDVFYFYIDDNTDGVYTFSNMSLDEFLENAGDGTYAATWIIRYDNADFSKLDSDGKCPNGTTPTEANPRCK